MPLFRWVPVALVASFAAVSTAAPEPAKNDAPAQKLEPAASSSAPNILLLIADDLGWVDVGTGRTNGGHGSKYHQTPQIDRLAAEGMSFTAAYAMQNCTPSRATLHSGQSPVRHWVYTVGGFEDVPVEERRRLRLAPPAGRQSDLLARKWTVAELLREAGYRTAVMGKVHGLGPAHGLDRNHGFDVQLAVAKQHWLPGKKRRTHYLALEDAAGAWHFASPKFDRYAAPYTTDYVAKNLAPFAHGNDPSLLVGTPKHLTDAIADAAIALIASEARRPEPFFIEVAFHAVHKPIRPRRDLRAKYAAREPSDLRHGDPAYAALVEGLDQSVGRIIAGLDDPNGDGDTSDSLRENTLVVFLSDNGGLSGQTSNAPLRGGKGTFLEGGLRVPFIVRMPGTVAAGTTSGEAVSIVDLYPTFAELSGAKLAASNKHPLDGESLMPLLTGAKKRLERPALFWHFPGYSKGRMEPSSVINRRHAGHRYKLAWSYDAERYTLYDLDADIGEKNDLLAGNPKPEHRKAAARLSGDLRRWVRVHRAPRGWVRASNTRVEPPPELVSPAPDG